jgi:signal transduction histidine kinase
LINDIPDLSKVEAGKLELNLAAVNLRPVLENSLAKEREKALKKDLKLRTEIDAIPDSIRADERKGKQIIYNLLANAMKFTPEGGKSSSRPVPCPCAEPLGYPERKGSSDPLPEWRRQ